MKVIHEKMIFCLRSGSDHEKFQASRKGILIVRTELRKKVQIHRTPIAYCQLLIAHCSLPIFLFIFGHEKILNDPARLCCCI